MKTHYIYTFVFLLCFSSCSDTKEKEESRTLRENITSENEAEVEIEVLKPSVFYHEIISNGKVEAANVADLRFQSAEVINHIWVKNGDKVIKGQKLAELDKLKLENKLVQAKDELERTKLEMQDVLIGQGYSGKESEEIPETTLKLAKVKSGYDRALASFRLAEYDLENATLTAPFGGVIANLFSKPHNPANTSETFCTVIDNTRPEVDFTILENELGMMKKGDEAKIIPFAGEEVELMGYISEINPMVDENGMVKVKAVVNNNGKLFKGMNVRVCVRRSLGNELVIPKSALVLRTGKQVVFTMKKGKAHWKYVRTGLENSSHYVVSEGLEPGDSIIISGNINLAHESSVRLKSKH